MQGFRIVSVAAGLALIASVASAQTAADAAKWGNEAKAAAGASLCVAGAQVEALSEGAWYPAVVLDALRDGRCFVHYEGYGSDDDEAMAPGAVRSRR
jgi:hypothetical protein